MFLKKYHIVKINHLVYKNIYKNIQFYDNKSLMTFLKENYNLVNFKIELILNIGKLNIVEAIEIYNLNPFRDNIKLSDVISSDTKSFLNRYKINDYKLEHYIYKDKSDEVYKVYMKNNSNSFDEYLFPDFQTFKTNLINIIKTGIEHTYYLEPSVIKPKEYLEILNLYGKFEDRNFKNSFEINQYINDMRKLSEIVIPVNEKVEIT